MNGLIKSKKLEVTTSLKDNDIDIMDDSPNSSLILKLKNAIWNLEHAIENYKFPINLKECEHLELVSYLPYFIEETSKSDVYVLLNRQYKPIGWLGESSDLSKFKLHQIELKYEQLDSLQLTSCNTFWNDYQNSPYFSKSSASKYISKLFKMINLLESS